MWSWLSGLTSENWQAIGSIGTLVVAVFAAAYARNQVREARRIRLEQSQPQVVVDLEAHSLLIELVIQNTGPTTARNVCFTFDPALESTLDESGKTKVLSSKILTDGIKSLPPGKSYRLLFEHGPDRYERSDLARSYEVTVVFTDSQRSAYKEQYTLDLDVLYGHTSVNVYGIHEAAQALREIKKIVSGWGNSRGLRVTARDGDKHDAEEREYIRAMREEQLQERNRSHLP